MEPTKRILINTLAQYTRAVLTTCMSLYSVRLVLKALGETDYGIYTLVAGIVAMLGFVTNAMVITTQRHLSYSFGQHDKMQSRKTFSCSAMMHLGIGVLLVLVLTAAKGPLFSHALSIPASRAEVASWIYTTTIGMMFLSFIEAPFKALFIARENIVYISVVEVTDGIMRLLLVALLLSGAADPLYTYGNLMLSIWTVRFLMFSVWPVLHYPECSPRHFLCDLDKKVIGALSGFAGWTTYSMGCVVTRNQGLNVVFSKSGMGMMLCASYGVAQQVVGGAQIVSTSILNAMNPQIMQAEGAGDRALMLHRAEQESRISSAMLATIFIPVIVFMDSILHIWLGIVPAKAAFLCQCLLLAQVIDQSTYGLHTANQAIGHIRNYTLLMYTPKVLILPLAWAIHVCGGGVEAIMLLFLCIEAMVAIMRIPYLHRHGGLNMAKFSCRVFPRIALIALLQGSLSAGLRCMGSQPFFTIASVCASILCGIVLMWAVVLNTQERARLKQIIRRGKA